LNLVDILRGAAGILQTQQLQRQCQ
jgi:hypothetical protein